MYDLRWPITFNGPTLQHHRLTNTIHLTLKMTSAQVVETSVTNNSSFQNYPHPDDHTIGTTYYIKIYYLGLLNIINARNKQFCTVHLPVYLCLNENRSKLSFSIEHTDYKHWHLIKYTPGTLHLPKWIPQTTKTVEVSTDSLHWFSQKKTTWVTHILRANSFLLWAGQTVPRHDQILQCKSENN